MAEINDLNITDGSNTARFPEAMAPSAVNDGARALEGLVARWHENINTSIATTGSANAYVLAAKGTQVLFDGMVIGFDANFANTGSATLNVDSTGAVTIKKFNDQNLASGDIEAGQKVIVVYDGASFQMLSPPAAPVATAMIATSAITAVKIAANAVNSQHYTDGSIDTEHIADDQITLAKMAGGTDGNLISYDTSGNPAAVATGSSGHVLTSGGAGVAPTFASKVATQAQQEATTETAKFVTPAVQHHHPTAAKAWIKMQGTGTAGILNSYNITSITDNGVGDYTITIATDFSGVSYGFTGAAGMGADGGGPLFLETNLTTNNTAGSFRIGVFNSSAVAKDAQRVGMAFFGDQ